MSTFQPSKSQHVDSAYGDAGGAGARGGGIQTTAAMTSTNSSSIATGTYSDADGYSYTVETSRITVYKKNGSKWKTLTPSDSSWDTVVTNLAKDKLKKTLKSGRTTPTATSSPSSSTSFVESALPAALDVGASGADPFYKQPWFPFAVGGGVLFIGIITWALWPEKPKKRLPVQVIMRERAPVPASDRIEEEREEQEEAA